MNEEQGDELISVLKGIRGNLDTTNQNKIEELKRQLRVIKLKLSREYFTIGLKESQQKYLDDVLNGRITFIKKGGL